MENSAEFQVFYSPAGMILSTVDPDVSQDRSSWKRPAQTAGTIQQTCAAYG
jgi:hypothetical protein